MPSGLQQGFFLADRQVLPLEGLITGPVGNQHVAPKAMDVLLFLAERAGEVVSRHQILRRVWGATPVSDEALTHCISELRKALDDHREDPHFIQTIPKRGYRLVAPVTGCVAINTGNGTEGNGGDAPAGATALLNELKRRKVIRVALGYPAITWLIVQMADIAIEHIYVDSPPWVMVGLIVLLALGYPVALFLAWAYEITESGIERDTALPPRIREMLRSGRAVDFLVIAGLAVLVVTLLYFVIQPPRPTPPLAPETIAVLPFRPANAQDADEWLGSGLAEQMINMLATLDGVDVAARTSSFRSDLQDMDVREIGRQLSVRHVLEGSVSSGEHSLLVTVRLIDADTGFPVWSETYTRTTKELFRIQSDIAEQVVKALKLALPVEFQTEIVKRPTDDVDAYDYYLQARSFLHRSATQSSLDNARQFFARAVERDPEFAAAYAGLCDVWLTRFELERSPELIASAEEACLQAIELDPDLAAARISLGNLYRLTAAFDEAVTAFGGAIRLDSKASDAHIGLARVFAARQQHKAAEKAFGKAIDSQPDYWVAHNAFGTFLFAHGRFEEAIRAYEQVIRLDPHNVSGYANLGAAYFMVGGFEQAAAAYREVIAREPTRGAYSNVGSSYYYLGRYEDAAVMYGEAITLTPNDHRLWGNLGDALAQLPERDRDTEEAYREAVRLNEDEMAVDPTDGTRLAALAHYRSRLGQHEWALEATAKAASLAPDDMYVHYYAALVHARLGREEAALVAIRQSVAAGYPVDLITADPLLGALRERPDFAALLYEET